MVQFLMIPATIVTAKKNVWLNSFRCRGYPGRKVFTAQKSPQCLRPIAQLAPFIRRGLRVTFLFKSEFNSIQFNSIQFKTMSFWPDFRLVLPPPGGVWVVSPAATINKPRPQNHYPGRPDKFDSILFFNIAGKHHLDFRSKPKAGPGTAGSMFVRVFGSELPYAGTIN